MLSFFVILAIILTFTINSSPAPQPEDEPPVVEQIVEDEPIEEPELPEVVETPAQSEAPKQEPLPTTGPAAPTPKRYTTIPEYEDDIMGLCPSERPATSFEYTGLLPTLGLRSSGPSSKTIEELKLWIGVYWSAWRTGQAVYPEEVDVGAIHRFGFDYVALSFYVNFSTLTVTYHNTWDDEVDLFEKVRKSRPELITKLDQTAKDMTAYLRYLDSAYTAKCPND